MNKQFYPFFIFTLLLSPLSLLGYTAYISNSSAGTISVLNTDTDTITATIPDVTTARAQAITPNGNFLYVVQAFPTNRVVAIDTSTNAVVQTITSASGIATPLDIAASPDGNFIYVSSSTTNFMTLISTVIGSTPSTINIGRFSGLIAINPAGTLAWTNTPPGVGSGITELNLPANTVSGGIILLSGPIADILFSVDGTKVYVARSGLNQVAVFDVVGRNIITSINVGTSPSSLARTPDGRFIYVSNLLSDTVSVIDTSTNTIVGSAIAVGDAPTSIAITPHGGHVYAANQTSLNGSKISTSTNSVTNTFSLISAPFNILISPLDAPSNLAGDLVKNNFAICYELYNALSWTASSTSDTLGYNIYRDGILIGSTSGINATTYEDHNRAEGTYYTYTVKAFAANGHESLAVTLTIL